MEFHRQYNLRRKKDNENSPKKATETKKTSENLPKKIPEQNDVESLTQKTLEILKRKIQTEVSSTIQIGSPIHRVSIDKSEVQSLNKTIVPFILEGELAKLKIPIPLSEMMNKNTYRSQVMKSLSTEPNIGTKALDVGSVHHFDTVNLVDDRPKLLFGPKFDGQTDNGVVAPFYISLNIHDLILHNSMLDLGASHNLMTKAMMEKLGLKVTRPYKDLHSLDSSKVKCIGLIKDLFITLAQILTKRLVMDIVIVEIPPKYGMLLSSSWGDKLRGIM
jgi:hypothetical protein